MIHHQWTLWVTQIWLQVHGAAVSSMLDEHIEVVCREPALSPGRSKAQKGKGQEPDMPDLSAFIEYRRSSRHATTEQKELPSTSSQKKGR